MLVALFAGDGIGPEIMAEARRVLDALGLDDLTYEEGLVGGAAYKAKGHPLPPETLHCCQAAPACAAALRLRLPAHPLRQLALPPARAAHSP